MAYSQFPGHIADALDALERLLTKHRLITPEQALSAARLITGDAAFTFPASKVPETSESKVEVPEASPTS